MPPIDIAEMVADWQAMSEELKNNTAREWYNKQKDVRWHFSEEQDQLIDKLLKVFEVDTNESVCPHCGGPECYRKNRTTGEVSYNCADEGKVALEPGNFKSAEDYANAGMDAYNNSPAAKLPNIFTGKPSPLMKKGDGSYRRAIAEWNKIFASEVAEKRGDISKFVDKRVSLKRDVKYVSFTMPQGSKGVVTDHDGGELEVKFDSNGKTLEVPPEDVNIISGIDRMKDN
jgi:hypothetical protein